MSAGHPQPTAGAVSGVARADDAARETSAFLRAILECADYAIISTGSDGVIRTFNRAAERMLGYCATEVIGQATPELFHDRDEVAQHAAVLTAELGRAVPATFEAFVAKARLGLADEQEWTYLRKDGSRLPVQFSVTAMLDEGGRIIGFLGVARDITRRRTAQARVRQLTENLEQRVRERTMQLEASQQRYEALAATAPVGIYHCEPDGRCTYVNQRWCDLTGLQLAEALGGGWSRALHPEDRPRVLDEWERAVREARPFQLEYRYRTPAGADVWVFGQAAAERNLDGRVISYVGTVTDITERKRAEQLTTTLAELGRQLSAADSRRAAAGTIFLAADRLLPFDAALLHVLSPDRRHVLRVLTVDTVNGWRAEQPGDHEVSEPSLMFRRVLRHGAQLIFRDGPQPPEIPFEPFGDARRESASLMFVPLRAGDKALGVLSLQSYTPRAYTEVDLALLQALADHAAGAFERFETEETLAESELRFRGTVEQAAVGVSHVSLDGRWLLVNDWLCDLVGYSRVELMAGTFQDITHPDDLGPDLENVRRMLAGEIPHYGMDKRYFHKDGSVIWIRLTVSLVRAADGTPKYFISIIQDIRARKAAEEALRLAHGELEARVRERTAELARTNMLLHTEVEERRNIEAALRESEARLRTIIDTARDAFVGMDDQGRVTDWNPQAEATFGWTRAEVMGRPLAELVIPPAMREAHRRGLERFRQTGQGTVTGRRLELTGVDRAGREFPVELTIAPIQLAGGWLFSAFLRDISERKQAEAALRESEARLRTIIDSTPDWIFIKDQELRYRMVNEGYAKAFHRRPEDFLGRNDLELGTPAELVRGDPAKGIRGFWADDREVMDTGQMKVIPEEPGMAAGEPMFLSTVKVPLRDGAGNVTGVLGYVRDITERKAMEAELRSREEQLRDLFENATDLIQSVAPDGRLIFVNRAWLNTLGYGVTDLATLTIFDIIHPDCLAECREQFTRVLQGEALENLQAIFRAKDGRKIHVEGNASCRFEHGRPVATRAIFRDITARKVVEAERERLIQELQAALAEVQTLSGLLPVCGWCKKVRDDSGYWNSVEGYLKKRTGADITHGICPDCSAKLMAELDKSAGASAGAPPAP